MDSYYAVMIVEIKTCSECGGIMKYIIKNKTNLYERYECVDCDNTEGYTGKSF